MAVTKTQLLGVTVDNRLSWEAQFRLTLKEATSLCTPEHFLSAFSFFFCLFSKSNARNDHSFFGYAVFEHSAVNPI